MPSRLVPEWLFRHLSVTAYSVGMDAKQLLWKARGLEDPGEPSPQQAAALKLADALDVMEEKVQVVVVCPGRRARPRAVSSAWAASHRARDPRALAEPAQTQQAGRNRPRLGLPAAQAEARRRRRLGGRPHRAGRAVAALVLVLEQLG